MSAPTFAGRLRPLAATALVALAALAAALSPPVTARPDLTLTADTTSAHPYSNPVWWPIDVKTDMGCYRGNPSKAVSWTKETCRYPTVQHDVWALDIPSHTRSLADPREAVYAAGSGIVHIGSTGWRCGSSPRGRGNWLWIDHGNGVSSQYGHVGAIKVRNGQYVTARTAIATIGNTGYAKCATTPDMRYLWFAIKTGGTQGPYVHFRTLKACVGASAQTWPTALNRAWTEWNQVPSRTELRPTSGRGCIAATPATPNKPSTPRLRTSGAGRLVASWALPTTGPRQSSIVAVLQQYHPTIHQWLDLRTHKLGATARSTTFTKLASKKLFRVGLWFGNGVGWSRPSSWSATVKAR